MRKDIEMKNSFEDVDVTQERMLLAFSLDSLLI
jgi:hypothetical protein